MKKHIKISALLSLIAMLGFTATSCAEDSIGARFLNGLEVLATGMIVIFAMLTIIFGAVKLISLFCYTIPQKKAAKKAASDVAEVPETATEPQAEEEPAEDDAEIVAAITAAISAYSESAPGSFRVVSFKRIK